MNKLRVLWLEDNECVLFNSLEKKVSGKCPSFVGKVAERVIKGEGFDEVLHDEGIDSSLYNRTKELITNISGSTATVQYPIKLNEQRFGKVLVLCPTASCNLKCIYCSGTAGEKSKQMMDWSLAKKSIDWFFDHCADSGPYTLQFHGAGEPLLNINIVKKSVIYAKDKAAKKGQKLFTRVSTNGIITKKTAEWVANNMDHVSLSLDGPPDIHNLHRPKVSGKDSYDNVLQTIVELEKTNVLKRINTVVTNHNIGKLEEILRHIRSVSKVKELRLLPVSNCGRCEQYAVKEVEGTRFETEMEKIIPLAKSLDIKLLSLIEQVDYFTDFYCGACGFNMVVAPNGNISTCIEVLDEYDAGADDMLIGKYDSTNDEFNVNWDKVAYLRTRTYKNIEGCKECTFRTNCSGSCLVRAARKHNSIMSFDDEQCNMVKEVLTKHYTDMARVNNLKTNGKSNGKHNSEDLTFNEVINYSKKVIQSFNSINRRDWTIEVAVIELTKQLGDLSKHVMTYEGYYLQNRSTHPNYSSGKENIANELADIMLGLIRIADHYNIDLGEAHIKARNDEMGYIKSSVITNKQTSD
jgi:uncharacterized protein